jgi:transcriptional regulator with XRE-family HTH domain
LEVFGVKEMIGERIKSLRIELGLTQRQLSGPGVTYPYVSRLEAGDRHPSDKTIRFLAGRLGVTPLWLETGSDDVECPHCGRPPGNSYTFD